MAILLRSFFERDAVQVAKALLGKTLVHQTATHTYSGMIIETEAYHGEADKASHASRGRTPRTETMYGRPGVLYVYLIYGRYHCLNIVTGPEGFPAAVLIRGLDRHGWDGPGRLCREMEITKEQNGLDICQDGAPVWVEDRGVIVTVDQIEIGARIGVNYAGNWKDKPWRFVLR